MSRETIQFSTADAYHQGLALLEALVPMNVRNEKRRVVASAEVPSCSHSGLAELGATISADGRYDADVE